MMMKNHKHRPFGMVVVVLPNLKYLLFLLFQQYLVVVVEEYIELLVVELEMGLYQMMVMVVMMVVMVLVMMVMVGNMMSMMV